MPILLTPALDALLGSRRHDLTIRQLSVLMSCKSGPQTVRGLAETIGVAKPAISRAADKLSEQGLLVREDDPADRRSVVLKLTNDGQKFASAFA